LFPCSCSQASISIFPSTRFHLQASILTPTIKVPPLQQALWWQIPDIDVMLSYVWIFLICCYFCLLVVLNFCCILFICWCKFWEIFLAIFYYYRHIWFKVSTVYFLFDWLMRWFCCYFEMVAWVWWHEDGSCICNILFWRIFLMALFVTRQMEHMEMGLWEECHNGNTTMQACGQERWEQDHGEEC
jgi:hypothetical protein